jgi:hypothetical protein
MWRQEFRINPQSVMYVNTGSIVEFSLVFANEKSLIISSLMWLFLHATFILFILKK